jgi:hypothetical protein
MMSGTLLAGALIAVVIAAALVIREIATWPARRQTDERDVIEEAELARRAHEP